MERNANSGNVSWMLQNFPTIVCTRERTPNNIRHTHWHTWSVAKGSRSRSIVANRRRPACSAALATSAYDICPHGLSLSTTAWQSKPYSRVRSRRKSKWNYRRMGGGEKKDEEMNSWTVIYDLVITASA